MAKKGSFIKLTVDTEVMVGALREAPLAVRMGIARAVERTTAKAYRRIRNRTPVDRGDARSGWKFRFQNNGTRAIISNNVPYITVLEYGGYPVRPKNTARRTPGSFVRGRARLSGFRPGPRTMRASGTGVDLIPKAEPRGRDMNDNVSRGAPLGMLRITFAEIEPEFVDSLEREIDLAFAGLET